MNLSQSVFPKVLLGELCTIQIGKTPSRANPLYWGKGSTWLSIADMNGELFAIKSKEEITEKAVRDSGIRIIQKGTLILSFKLSIGKVSITGKDLYTNEAIAGLRIIDDSRVFQKYLYYVLREFDLSGTSDKAVKGLTLNKSKLYYLKIPLPTLTEQKRIAAILDHADSILGNNKQIVEKYNELTQSVFYEMFGELTINPKKWKEVLLDTLCTEIIDCPHSTPKHSSTITNYPCIRTSEIKEGRINWKSMLYLDYEDYIKRTKRLKPLPGDIVYGREGSFGDAAIVPESTNLALGQRVMLFRVNRDLVNEVFFWAQIRSPFVYRQALKLNCGATVGHVNIKDIKHFTLLLPPIELQTRFAQILMVINNQRHLSQISLDKSEDLFQSLLQSAFKEEI